MSPILIVLGLLLGAIGLLFFLSLAGSRQEAKETDYQRVKKEEKQTKKREVENTNPRKQDTDINTNPKKQDTYIPQRAEKKENKNQKLRNEPQEKEKPPISTSPKTTAVTSSISSSSEKSIFSWDKNGVDKLTASGIFSKVGIYGNEKYERLAEKNISVSDHDLACVGRMFKSKKNDLKLEDVTYLIGDIDRDQKKQTFYGKSRDGSSFVICAKSRTAIIVGILNKSNLEQAKELMEEVRQELISLKK